MQLVAIAYSRSAWFRLVREPLKWGMLAMGRLYRVDARAYSVSTPCCSGCVRFTKTGLRDRSGLFRWLNAHINPVFDRLLESIVTSQEVAEAKRCAARYTRHNVN